MINLFIYCTKYIQYKYTVSMFAKSMTNVLVGLISAYSIKLNHFLFKIKMYSLVGLVRLFYLIVFRLIYLVQNFYLFINKQNIIKINLCIIMYIN